MNLASLRAAVAARTGIVALLVVIVSELSPCPVVAQPGAPTPSAKRERDAVHFTDALRANDPKVAETFDGAAESLQAGHEVVILFDGRSVTALRMNLKSAKRTPLEELGLAREEQTAWAERLALPAAQAPRNRLELVQRLAAAGAKVFVNRNAVKLYGLSDEEIHPIATPISARQMAKLLDETGLCYTYRH
jgi:PAS domain-containing protein